MLVENIVKLIKSISDYERLSNFDTKLIENMTKYFSQKETDASLSIEDIEFLLDCFKNRWFEVIDTDADYMLNPSGVNERWVDLAKEIASDTEKNFVQILIPEFTNTIDFNNLSLLTETSHLEYFFLAQGNKILCRKRGLFDLIQESGSLGTRRNIHNNTISPLTVIELYRLKSCKQTKGEFSVANEIFVDFWDYLNKKVFSSMYTKGKIPNDFLPSLIGLIERYYELKTNKSDFNLFKKEASKVFDLLYQCELNNVNHFYGVTLHYKGKNQYLFDLLIDIHKAQNYDLEECWIVLSKFLYQFYANVNFESKELKQLDALLKLDNTSRDNNESRKINEKAQLEHESLTMVLSLFTQSFDYAPFANEKINLWDKTNTVFSEAIKIMEVFTPLIEKNKIEEFHSAYSYVLKSIVKPALNDMSTYTLLTRCDTTKDWLKRVEQKQLSTTGVYWFEPELMLEVLLHIKSSNQSLNKNIISFLDELIRTYAQNASVLLKKFRVNILFADFMSGLSTENKNHIFMLMNLYDFLSAKQNFIFNCVTYINNRLAQLGFIPNVYTSQLFNSGRKIDMQKIIDLDNLGLIIETYKNILNKQSEDTFIKDCREYLLSLSHPILTVLEIEQSEYIGRNIDYLGGLN